MPIFLPDKCLRGRKDCKPLSLIDSDTKDKDGITFFCCGENDGTYREVEQDKYTLCFKNCSVDIVHHNDKRDLIHQMFVIAQALAIIEEGENED